MIDIDELRRITDGQEQARLTGLQRSIALMAMIILLVVTLTGMYIRTPVNDHREIIRLHVIANSNSAGDQALKLKVRDGVLAQYGVKMESATIDKARTNIATSIGDINALAEQIIQEQGYDYTAKSRLGVTYIPAKSYDHIDFPAGNYEALNIVIGDGAGDNWWCVLFPPLCLIDSSADDDKDVDRLGKLGKPGKQGESGKFQKPNTKSKQAIILRFKVAEIAKKYQKQKN